MKSHIGPCLVGMEARASYRVDLFDAFDQVDSRVADGRKWLNAVGEFFAKKAALDKEYSKKLMSLCKSVGEQDFG